MKKLLTSNQPASKTDVQRLEDRLKKFATKTELKKVEKNLRTEILKVEEKVEKVADTQKQTNTKLDKIYDTLISFVGRVDNLETENEIGTEQIRKLDKRITTLESVA